VAEGNPLWGRPVVPRCTARVARALGSHRRVRPAGAAAAPRCAKASQLSRAARAAQGRLLVRAGRGPQSDFTAGLSSIKPVTKRSAAR